MKCRRVNLESNESRVHWTDTNCNWFFQRRNFVWRIVIRINLAPIFSIYFAQRISWFRFLPQNGAPKCEETHWTDSRYLSSARVLNEISSSIFLETRSRIKNSTLYIFDLLLHEQLSSCTFGTFCIYKYLVHISLELKQYEENCWIYNHISIRIKAGY